jgi:arylsulfatase A-like enzyme
VPRRSDRALLSALALVILVVALATVSGPTVADETAAADDASRPPNVVFIAIDDLNDWVGVLGGHPQAKTPNIDRLAARGMLFTRAYAPAPACNPSRVSLLTGRRPSTSGVYYNGQPFRTAMPDVITLPQLFKQNGYRVEARGKIFHESPSDPASWHLEIARGESPVPTRRPLNGIRRAPGFD